MPTTIIEDYLEGREGSVVKYRDGLRVGYRIGQAFFLAASKRDQVRLRGRFWDPFFKDTQEDVYKTIEWLLDNE